MVSNVLVGSLDDRSMAAAVVNLGGKRLSRAWDGKHLSPMLTPEGRSQLEARSRLLLERITNFEAPEPSEPPDSESADRYESLLNEFIQLCHMIHSSSSVEDVPDDPGVVLLGDEVVVSCGIGRIERYVIVDPLEAALEAGRISSESPLGSGLLGRSVGESLVMEDNPGQAITILSASRRKR